jgi:8-oxo-dGTP diphosphatase
MSSGPPSPVDWKTWVPGIRATLMFVVRGAEVLLIRKKRGIGAGKINGPGGKIDPGESPLESAVRETEEELGITPLHPVKAGELLFAMTDMEHIHCHVFVASDHRGEPVETAEAVPLWTAIDKIPYQEMWEDDRHWLPGMLAGRTFVGRFAFRGEELRWHQLTWDVEFE